MSALLTRFKLLPPGVKRPDGSWSLLKVNVDSNYTPFLAQHADTILNSKEKKLCNSTLDWNDIASPHVAKYLLSKHPQIQFLDFSEPCNLTILTHIQAAGITEKYWLGKKSTAGSSHFIKSEARNRTICEVLERTALSELQLPLNKIWGSAVAPSHKLAELKAIEESLERWITYHAWSKTAEYRFFPLSVDDFSYSGIIRAALFEWERYKAQINIFLVVNPYNIPVILVQIQTYAYNKLWTFFSNGIGSTLSQALIKALLESIQFVPGKHSSSWLEEIQTSSQSCRLLEWRQLGGEEQKYNFTNHINKDFENEELYYHSLLNMLDYFNGEIIIYPFQDCPELHLGCSYIPSILNWSDHKGIPIA